MNGGAEAVGFDDQGRVGFDDQGRVGFDDQGRVGFDDQGRGIQPAPPHRRRVAEPGSAGRTGCRRS